MYECCTSATAFLPDPDPDPDPDPEPTFLDVRFWILVRIWLKIISSNMFLYNVKVNFDIKNAYHFMHDNIVNFLYEHP